VAALKGEKAVAVARNTAGTWYKLVWNGVEGWSSALYWTKPGCTLPVETVMRAPPVSDFGLHLIFSAEYGAVMRALPQLGSLKATDGAENILRAAKTQRPDLLTVWRSLTVLNYGTRDCPPQWGQGDASIVADGWWAMLFATWQRRGVLPYTDFFELVNECGAAYFTWENAFWIRTLENANLAGVCIAVFSDAYGTPELFQFVARRPVLNKMLSSECKPGMHHAVAVHSYEGANSGMWKFGRWRLYLDALGSEYEKLPWLVTEYGYNLGTGAVNCDAFVTDWREAAKRYAPHTEIWGAMVFSVGASLQWTDVTACLG